MPYAHHLLSDFDGISWLLLYTNNLFDVFAGIIFNCGYWKHIYYELSFIRLPVHLQHWFLSIGLLLFFIFCLKLGFNKHLKVTEPIFWGKFKLGNWEIFGWKRNTYELFFKSAHYIFLKLYMMTGSTKWFTVIALDFREKSYYA